MVLNLKRNKTFKVIITVFILITFTASVISCKEALVVAEQPAGEEQGQEEIENGIKNNEVVIDSPEIKPVEEEAVEKIDVPEIPGLTFNQETKSYFNEAGVEVGLWVENAVKINGEMKSAIALKPEAINKILEENRQKGIFKCPWPFDFQKNKGIEIVELFNNPLHEEKVFERMGAYLPDVIGIKYSEPIDFYAPFDASFKGSVTENIPDEKDPDFYSAQSFKNIAFGNKDLGDLQYNFIDWEPKVELSEAKIFDNDAYLQDILREIKCGDFLGRILPNTADFNFLDFTNNKEFYENPGQFQGRLTTTDSSDDFSQPTSSLEKMLNYKNKAGQEIPVCVWPEEKTAHEQNN